MRFLPHSSSKLGDRNFRESPSGRSDKLCRNLPEASARFSTWKVGGGCPGPRNTLTNQNPLFCRAPINSIYGFILGTYKIVGSGWLR